MAIKFGISSTSESSLTVKADAYSDGYVLFDKGDAYKPGIRYNYSQSKLQFSNNGTSYSDITTSILGGDLSGTTTTATIDKIKGITVNTTTPQDGYAYIYSQSANQWVPSKVNNSTVITAGKQDILTANATSYILPNFTESTDETAIAFLAPVGGTLSNLVCYCSTAPGGSESVAITVRKNGVDTAITGTISGSATTASDLSNTVNLASGDRVTIKSVVTAGSSAANLFVSLIFTVPTMNSAIVSGGSGGATYGIYSNMPSSTSSGSVYYATDSPTSTWVYGNSAWNPIVKDVICKKPPLASAFTKINDGGAGHSLTDAYGSLIFSVPNDGANTYNRGYCISYSNASAYVECVVPLNLYAPASDYYFTGLIMRESSTAKSYSIGFRKENTNVMSLQIFKRANDNDAATYTMAAINNSNDYMFLRIRLSGSNIISEYSSDKYIWAQFNSSTIASIFTTAPNQIGLSGWGYNRTASHVIQHFDYGSL